jgi:hypothetical protein
MNGKISREELIGKLLDSGVAPKNIGPELKGPSIEPRVLDLFCCSGGAARGFQMAGFKVDGVDVVKRPRYCGDTFLQGDALDVLADLIDSGEIRRYTLVHTSPPCQAGCTMTNGTNKARGWGKEHTQLVPETRDLLEKTGLPYIIEQPQGHGGLIRTDLRLCMDMFPVEPPRVFRHRDFELGGPWPFVPAQPHHPKHTGRVRGMRHSVYHHGDYVAAYGNDGGKATVQEMQHALGIDWTSEREELTEAIPPAYTAFIGQAFLAVDQLAA